MAYLTKVEQLTVSPEAQEPDLPCIEDKAPFVSPEYSGSPWNFSTILALFLLVLLWAAKLYTTWGAWGNLTVDSGHEMYVPWMLAEGKLLYRDVWFMYGPGAPYFTSYLFRLFGERLNVLYWAGSISALGSAIFLYLTGMRISSWRAGWTAGAVVLMEAFQPSLFCFPLPYAFAAVYGCFTGCLFLWFSINAAYSKAWPWIFGAGTAAALALLLKLEFGIACYGTLALLIAVRGFSLRSWRHSGKDCAAILPGMVLCGLVFRWMVSIAGVEFITQENFMSWPTSYFMKAYGKMWLEGTGFTISGTAFSGAFHRSITVAAVVLVIYVFLRWKAFDIRSLFLKALIVLALGLYLAHRDFFVLSMKNSLSHLLSSIFFPQEMVLYVMLGAVAAWGNFRWMPASGRKLALPLILTFSSLLAFRILMKTNTIGYSIFYNGPVVLSFLLLLFLVIPRSNGSRRFLFLGESVLCLACLAPVFLHTRLNEAAAKDFVPFSTDRGTIRIPGPMAENYKSATQFMKEKAHLGQTVLSVPEDTSLYFLSGTICPTRVYLFTPGALAPGKMVRETIEQIDREPVRYLLWSNRTFPEYGVSTFGQDYDRELGAYLKSHYRPMETPLPHPGDDRTWTYVIWERNPESDHR